MILRKTPETQQSARKIQIKPA
ncbi:conserved hypothetical protein [Sinorhizobium medicae]|uniref:Uncharacterized protein n=1 Tax=Sinorhizobium medicae TaxID=110321 RepID=A0A508WVM8_9HYPH|nr:conserved hypothetical protein [Sinorhizobium medicae]